MSLKTKLEAVFGDNERAVSPVIGVILMVAITVILAAVIATFVTGLGGNVNSNVQAGASISDDQDANEIKVTFTSAQEDGTTLVVNAAGGATEGEAELGAVGDTIVLGTGTTDDVKSGSGSSITTDAEFSNGVRITITVTAQNAGKSTVVLSETIEI